jgi:hypothetical protein
LPFVPDGSLQVVDAAHIDRRGSKKS